MVLDRNEILQMLYEQRIDADEALRLLDRKPAAPAPTQEVKPDEFDIRGLLSRLKPRISSKDVSRAAAAFLELEFWGRLRLFQVCQSMGLFTEPNKTDDIAGLCAGAGIQSKFQRYFNQLCDMLVKERLVHMNDGFIQATPRVGEATLQEKLRALPESKTKLQEKEPSLAGHMDVLDHCLNALPGVLRGQTAVEAVREPIRAALQDMHQQDHHSQFLNDLCAQLTAAYQHHQDGSSQEQRELQVFEWSSGGASAAGAVAETLQADQTRVHYNWTADESEAVAFARHRWGAAFPFMAFHKLDLNRHNPTLNHFTHQADILFCTNSLHRVAYFPEAMTHCRRLLKPGGLLIIREMLAPRDFSLLTAGFDPRWWRFEDGERRLPQLPIADSDGWMAALDQAGFECLSAIGLPIENRFSFQGLIIARAPQAEPVDLRDQSLDELAVHLPYQAESATAEQPRPPEDAEWLQHHEPKPETEPNADPEPVPEVSAEPHAVTAQPAAGPHLLVRQTWSACPGRPASDLPDHVLFFLPNDMNPQQTPWLHDLPCRVTTVAPGPRFRRLSDTAFELPLGDAGALRLLCHALRNTDFNRIIKIDAASGATDWQAEHRFLQDLEAGFRSEGRYGECPTTLVLREKQRFAVRALNGICQALRISGTALQPRLLQTDERRSLATQLRHELRIDPHLTGTTFRNKKGQRRRLVLEATLIPTNRPSSIRRHGVYLILGDLTGAAFSLAEQLHHQADARLLVFPWRRKGLQNPPWPQLPDPGRLHELSDLTELEPHLEQIRREGLPLNGVFFFHHPRAHRTFSVLEQLRRLDLLTQSQPLDFFSVATSGSAYLGEWGSPATAVDENLCAAFVHQRNGAAVANKRRGETYCLRIVDETHQGLPDDGLDLYRNITGIEEPNARLIADTLLNQPGRPYYDLCLIAGDTHKLAEFIQEETGLLHDARRSTQSLFQHINEDVKRLWRQEERGAGDHLQALIDFFGWEPEFLLLDGFQEAECVRNLLAYHRDQLLVFYGAQALPSRQLERWVLEKLQDELGTTHDVDAGTPFAALPFARRTLESFCRRLGSFLGTKLTPALCLRHPSAALLAAAVTERFPEQIDRVLTEHWHWEPAEEDAPAAAAPEEPATPSSRPVSSQTPALISAPQTLTIPDTGTTELIPLSAKSHYILQHKAARLAAFIEDQAIERLRFLAQQHQDRPAENVRLMVLAEHPAQAVAILRAFAAGEPHAHGIYGARGSDWLHFGSDAADQALFLEYWRNGQWRKLADLWTRGVAIPWPHRVASTAIETGPAPTKPTETPDEKAVHHEAAATENQPEMPTAPEQAEPETTPTMIAAKADELVVQQPPMALDRDSAPTSPHLEIAPIPETNSPVEPVAPEEVAPGVTSDLAPETPEIPPASEEPTLLEDNLAEPPAHEAEPVQTVIKLPRQATETALEINAEPDSDEAPALRIEAADPDQSEAEALPMLPRSSASLSEGQLRLFIEIRQALCSLLDLEEKIVDPAQSLFLLGLNSINAVRLQWHLEHRYGIDLPLGDFLDNPTLEGLSERVSERNRQPHDTVERGLDLKRSDTRAAFSNSLAGTDTSAPFPFSAMQNYLRWMHRQVTMGNYYFELEETGLDIQNLRASWEYVVEHHEMLRANLVSEEQQVIEDDLSELNIEIFDLSEEPQKIDTFFTDLRDEWAAGLFDVGSTPRWRLALVQLPDEVVRIALCIDRMLLDFSSLPHLLQTWFAYYRNLEPPLPGGTFSQFMQTKQKIQDHLWYQRDLEYWKHRLDHFEPYPLFAGAADFSSNFRRLYAQLAPPTWHSLAEKARTHRITLPILLSHTFATTLAFFSSSKAFSFLIESNHRLPFFQDVSHVVGPFHALALYPYNPNWEMSIADCFREVQRDQWQDLDHATARAEATLAVSDRLGDFPIIVQMSHQGEEETDFKGWNHVCQWVYSRNALPKPAFTAHFMLGGKTLETAWEVPHEGLGMFRQMLDFFFLTLLHLANCNWEEKPLPAAIVPILNKHTEAAAMMSNFPNHILDVLQNYLKNDQTP